MQYYLPVVPAVNNTTTDTERDWNTITISGATTAMVDPLEGSNLQGNKQRDASSMEKLRKKKEKLQHELNSLEEQLAGDHRYNKETVEEHPNGPLVRSTIKGNKSWLNQSINHSINQNNNSNNHCGW